MMLFLNFGQIPGIRLAALCLTIVEIGTIGYVAFAVWRNHSLYKWLMNVSNVLWFVFATLIVYMASPRSWQAWVMWLLMFSFVLGRYFMMQSELARDLKR